MKIKKIPFQDEIDIHINPQEMAVSKKHVDNGSPPQNKDLKIRIEVEKIFIKNKITLSKRKKTNFKKY